MCSVPSSVDCLDVNANLYSARRLLLCLDNSATFSGGDGSSCLSSAYSLWGAEFVVAHQAVECSLPDEQFKEPDLAVSFSQSVCAFRNERVIAVENMALTYKSLDIIVSDLCPLRKRGQYMAVILAIFGIGVALGPFIGGAIVQTTTWRWVFYINLPIGGFSFGLMFLFLRVHYEDSSSLKTKLRRIDVIGNGILMAGTVAILYALSYAGTRYSWGSWNTLVPLILGLVGFVAFIAFERSGIAAEPVMPMRLFANRTSITVLLNTFINSMIYF